MQQITLQEYLENHIATSKEIQQSCQLTARQVLFQIKKMGNRVIRIANGKSPRYALSVSAFEVGNAINLWEVDSLGNNIAIATLHPLAIGGFFVAQTNDMPAVFLGKHKNGFYNKLPFFLQDMAPKGFLGKKIAIKLANNSHNFPTHLSDWTSQHLGRYLLANADNGVGNLKLGNNVELNIRTEPNKHSRKDYLAIADETVQHESVLSCVGGNQQKFTTFCIEKNAHVLVKFSPKGDSENALRWKDVLITEHYAAKILNKTGLVQAANTQIFEKGGRVFLESERFDRIGEQGRSSMLSLSIIDAEFVGSGLSWEDSASQLFKQKLLSKQDLSKVQILSFFAKLINNTDTHLGNISFKAEAEGFSLLPIYDMGSMGFAPKSNGEVLPFDFKPPKFKKVATASTEDFKTIYLVFWQQVLNDPLTSKEMKSFITRFLINN